MNTIPCEKLRRNWKFPTMVCTTPFRGQHKRALTRVDREVGGPGALLSKKTSILESLVWEIDASQVLNWVEGKGLSNTPKTDSNAENRICFQHSRQFGLQVEESKKLNRGIVFGFRELWHFLFFWGSPWICIYSLRKLEIMIIINHSCSTIQSSNKAFILYHSQSVLDVERYIYTSSRTVRYLKPTCSYS